MGILIGRGQYIIYEMCLCCVLFLELHFFVYVWQVYIKFWMER